jgi:hypothetical protein
VSTATVSAAPRPVIGITVAVDALSDDRYSDYVTVDLPWRQEVTLRGVKGPAIASITAARVSGDYAGLVGCRVIYQGRTLASEPATSAYAFCGGNAAPA